MPGTTTATARTGPGSYDRHDPSARWDGQGEDNLARFLTGCISYEEFCRLDAALLAGQRYADLQKVARTVPLRAGAAALFDCLRRHDYHIALISTGLRILTSRKYSVTAWRAW